VNGMERKKKEKEWRERRRGGECGGEERRGKEGEGGVSGESV